MKPEADYNFHKTSKLGFILSQTIPIHTIISNFNTNFISVLSAHLRFRGATGADEPWAG
jgi:hypothetical protein